MDTRVYIHNYIGEGEGGTAAEVSLRRSPMDLDFSTREAIWSRSRPVKKFDMLLGWAGLKEIWGFCRGRYRAPLKGFGVDIRQV